MQKLTLAIILLVPGFAAFASPHPFVDALNLAEVTSPLRTISPPPSSDSAKKAVNQEVAEKNEDKPKEKAGESWNLQDVDIRSFIQHVSSVTGKNFIIDPRVQGKVSIISQSTLSPDELYQVFLSTLQVYGFAIVNTGNVTKIVPSLDARTQLNTDGSNQPRTYEDYVVRLIPVENVAAKEMVNSLRTFVDKNANINFYSPSNHIIVADRRANIDKLVDLVKRLDRPTNRQIEIIHLNHANATEMVELLANLEKSNQDENPDNLNIRFAADTRSNSVLISGGSGNRMRYRSLIAEMDVLPNNSGNVQVIYLKFVRARDLAPIIANVIASAQAPDVPPVADSNSSAAVSTPTQPQSVNTAPTRAQNNNFGNMNGSSSSNTSGSRLNQQPNFGSLEDQAKSGAASNAVQWEETTNSLIVKAPPAIMETVHRVISKLDIRRPQVMVEAIIAEIMVDRTRDLGIEWNTGGAVNVGTRFPTSSLSLPALGSDPSQIFTGSGLTLGFFRHDSLRGLLRALANDSTTNILSPPNIVTLDNETATIKVGQLVPFATGRSTDSLNTGGTPFTSFTREEVGLTLTIRPQITQSGAIKLQIDHILSNVVPGVVDTTGANNPTTAERLIQTNVLVDDGEVLVLGGLIRDDWTKANSRVPGIGDVPIVGNLFGSKSKIHAKRNLMVFLRPVIMRDKTSAAFVTGGKYNDIRQQQLFARYENEKKFPAEPEALPRHGGDPNLPAPLREWLPKSRIQTDAIEFDKAQG